MPYTRLKPRPREDDSGDTRRCPDPFLSIGTSMVGYFSREACDEFDIFGDGSADVFYDEAKRTIGFVFHEHPRSQDEFSLYLNNGGTYIDLNKIIKRYNIQVPLYRIILKKESGIITATLPKPTQTL